jgi:sugar lactone lactonase YvrE
MTLYAAGLALTAACTGDTSRREAGEAATLPTWAFDSSMIFRADGALLRPEDGVALADGRLIVTDQAHGLRLIETDGTSNPFGDMVSAGYTHRPPDHSGGANGVSLEPDGKHLLVTDVYHGGIYRVDVASGATERVYQHRYGVNAAVRDTRGAIWFTQSAHNTAEEGEPRLWAAVESGQPEGALFRLAGQDGRLAPEASLMLDSLHFANGLAIDEQSGHLYISDMLAGRVLRYRVDLASGRLSEESVFVDSVAADNLELDTTGHLWMALPLNNQLMAVNTTTGARHSAFRAQTPAQQERSAEVRRRLETGEPRLELFTPELWAPMPGLITGVILSPGGGPAYLTSLGDALIRLQPADRPAPGD